MEEDADDLSVTQSGFLQCRTHGVADVQGHTAARAAGDGRHQVTDIAVMGGGGGGGGGGVGVAGGVNTGGRGVQEFPKPQIVSVVWYWNWANLLVLIFGVLPGVLGGIVCGYTFGLDYALAGFAFGFLLAGLTLLYVIFNR